MIITVNMNPTIDVSVSTERLEPVRKLRCSSARRDPCGGGVNVARVISRLWGQWKALYPAGGFFGDTSGPALAAAVAKGVFLIKPNLRELSERGRVGHTDPAQIILVDAYG